MAVEMHITMATMVDLQTPIDTKAIIGREDRVDSQQDEAEQFQDCQQNSYKSTEEYREPASPVLIPSTAVKATSSLNSSSSSTIDMYNNENSWKGYYESEAWPCPPVVNRTLKGELVNDYFVGYQTYDPNCEAGTCHTPKTGDRTVIGVVQTASDFLDEGFEHVTIDHRVCRLCYNSANRTFMGEKVISRWLIEEPGKKEHVDVAAAYNDIWAQAKEERDSAQMATEKFEEEEGVVKFVFDSAASSHMTPYRNGITERQSITHRPIGTPEGTTFAVEKAD